MHADNCWHTWEWSKWVEKPKQSLRLWPFVLLSKLAQEATQNTMSLCYIGNRNLHWHSGASNLISCSGVWSDNLVKKWKQCCLSKCFHHGWPFQIWKSKPPARECRQLARRPEHANVQTRLLKDNPHQSSAVNTNRITMWMRKNQWKSKLCSDF